MVNKQRFASWLGLCIVMVHIAMAAYLFFFLHPNADRLVAAGEIILPMTTAYSLTVVTWFIGNRGVITGTEQIGAFLVALAIIIVGCFLVSLPIGAWLYLQNRLTPEGLNLYYTTVESAFGGMFVLIFNFMFDQKSNN